MPSLNERVETWLVDNYSWLHLLPEEDVIKELHLEIANGRLHTRPLDDTFLATARKLKDKYKALLDAESE